MSGRTYQTKYQTEEEARLANLQRAQASYWEDPEAKKQYSRNYYQKNKERILEQRRQQRQHQQVVNPQA